MVNNLDSIDRRILGLLQADASISVADIGERVGLSRTPCWQRIQKLQAAGVIRKRVALLDPEKLNVGTTVFVRIKTAHHNQRWLERFSQAVAGMEEVVEFYRMSGEIDYLLRIVVPDIASYDAVYKRLIAAADLSDVSSSFALETIKQTTALPTGYV